MSIDSSLLIDAPDSVRASSIGEPGGKALKAASEVFPHRVSYQPFGVIPGPFTPSLFWS
jgi:hypothetical protein